MYTKEPRRTTLTTKNRYTHRESNPFQSKSWTSCLSDPKVRVETGSLGWRIPTSDEVGDSLLTPLVYSLTSRRSKLKEWIFFRYRHLRERVPNNNLTFTFLCTLHEMRPGTIHHSCFINVTGTMTTTVHIHDEVTD